MNKKILILSLMCSFVFISCSNQKEINKDRKQNKVYKWEDYYNSEEYPGGEDFYREITLKEFPDTTLVWSDMSIMAEENGIKKGLFFGMPIMNVYFTDLNNDEYPEICASVCFGSGIIDEHIEVYDLKNDKKYTLCERMRYDYRAVMKDDELLIEKRPYSPYLVTGPDDCEVGKLVIKNDELKFIGLAI